MYKLCYLLFVYFLSSRGVHSFNLDTDFPIIYSDPYIFNGYNLTRDSYFGYSVLLYGGTNQNEPWIQIGAPRGLNPDRENKTTGVIFRCGIKSSCSHIPLKSFVTDGVDDEAFFGNTMDINSNNDMYAICGHRWIHQAGLDYYIQGACFSGRPNATKTDFFTPLRGKDDQHILLPNNKRVYNKAQAQVGFSAQFVKGENELLVGLPGFLNWKGVPGLLKRQYQPPASRRRRDVYDFVENKIPNGQLVSDIKFFDLGGYSVTSGRFFDSKNLYFATGAPRANMKGSVLIFQFVGETLTVKDRKDGTSFGEYFGSSITASDINDDGLEDLIVGAPFHKSPGSDAKFDDGAIYVYLGSRDKLIDAVTNVIEGKASGGRFGESVMSLGDIDKDGCGDIAVAAPYENDHSGVVYIYRGDKRTGLIKEPSQIIAGKSIIPNVKGFGISLSKPADIDGNNYDDIAIGAYKSGHAVLLRAKPVVVLRHSLESTVGQVDAQNKTEPFVIHSCAGFQGQNITQPIKVIRKISVDPDNPGRATIIASSNYVSEMLLQYPMQYCENFTIRISDSNKDIYNPIVIKASLILDRQNETTSQIIVSNGIVGTDNFCKTCPVVGSTSDATQQVNIDFNRGCRDKKICYSHLILSAVFIGLEKDVYVIGSKKYVTMEAIVTNNAENAFQTEIHISPPNPVRLRSIPSYCKEVASTIICTIDNPLETNASRKISLEMDFEEVNSGKYEDILEFPLKVTTTSDNNGQTNKTLSLQLVKNADVELMGISNEETYSYKNRTYGKSSFQHTYKIMKHGISPIKQVALYISIPRNISVGNTPVTFISVYSPEGTLAGQSITCSSNIKYVVDSKNVDGGVNEMDKKKRKRRDTTTVDNLAKYPSNRTIYMNCSTEGVTCDEIRCNMGPFKNAKHVAEIKLKMDLDVSGLTGYMAEKDIFIVSTNARLEIEDKVSNNNTNTLSHSTSVPSVFIGPSAEQSIATWIIIVAIICGILLLLLLAGVLYKLGFFKRTKKELLINEKAKHNGEDQREPLHDNNDP